MAPPSTGQVEHVVASGCPRFDNDFAATTAGRLGSVVCGRHPSPATVMRMLGEHDEKAAAADVNLIVG